jgi:DNA primase
MLSKKIKKSDLLSKIPDQEIFKKYFGELDLNKSYNSVFRKDKRPSTGFYINRNGKLIYNDFVTGEKLDCIDFVSKVYEISIDKAIDKILTDFGIKDHNELSSLETKVVVQKEKKKKVYDVGYSDWTQEHLDYWNSYCITQKELEDNYVYPVDSIYVNGYCVANGGQLRFCYLINTPKDTYIKIYSPFDPEYKWMGNVPGDEIFGYYDLPYKSKTLIITKSQKDRILFKKYFTDVIAVQREGTGVITEEQAKSLMSKYDNIYVNFDVDKQFVKGQWRYLGKEAMTHFNKEYGWKWINVPNHYFDNHGIKDFSDLVKERGIKVFENYLKHKELI